MTKKIKKIKKLKKEEDVKFVVACDKTMYFHTPTTSLQCLSFSFDVNFLLPAFPVSSCRYFPPFDSIPFPFTRRRLESPIAHVSIFRR